MSDTNTKQTEQHIQLNQLVVLVRPKMSTESLSVANNLIDSPASKIQSVASSAEELASKIPLVGDTIIKEEKKEKNPKPDESYTYFNDYTSWDNFLNDTKTSLEKVSEESDTLLYEYKADTLEERQSEGLKLYGQLKGKISAWINHYVAIHFVVLDQGGNVAIECTNLLATDQSFLSQKWWIDSMISIGTPNYKNIHILNPIVLKNRGSIVSFGNRYDLTNFVTNYFEPNKKLIDKIKNSNNNLLSINTATIRMHVAKIMAYMLDNMPSIGTSGTNINDIYDHLSQEIKDVVKDICDIYKKLVNEGTSIIDLNGLPDFTNILGLLNSIPQNCVNEFKICFYDAVDELITWTQNKISDPINHAIHNSYVPINVARASNEDIDFIDVLWRCMSKTLNCLCPLYDFLTDSLRLFRYDEKTSKQLCEQILESCGIEKINTPSSADVDFLNVDSFYLQEAVNKATSGNPDMTPSMISKTRSLLINATNKSEIVSVLDTDSKQLVAEAIGTMLLPMLPSKLDFYKKLLELDPFGLIKVGSDKAKEIEKNTHQNMDTPIPLGVSNSFLPDKLKTPDRLRNSVSKLNSEIQRIAQYLDKMNYKIVPSVDSTYLIYNSHNLLLKQCPKEVLECLEQQTGYATYKRKKEKDGEQIIPTREMSSQPAA